MQIVLFVNNATCRPCARNKLVRSMRRLFNHATDSCYIIGGPWSPVESWPIRSPFPNPRDKKSVNLCKWSRPIAVCHNNLSHLCNATRTGWMSCFYLFAHIRSVEINTSRWGGKVDLRLPIHFHWENISSDDSWKRTHSFQSARSSAMWCPHWWSWDERTSTDDFDDLRALSGIKQRRNRLTIASSLFIFLLEQFLRSLLSSIVPFQVQITDRRNLVYATFAVGTYDWLSLTSISDRLWSFILNGREEGERKHGSTAAQSQPHIERKLGESSPSVPYLGLLHT